jgi:hypothetical protein
MSTPLPSSIIQQYSIHDIIVIIPPPARSSGPLGPFGQCCILLFILQMRKHRLDTDGGLAVDPTCILHDALSGYGCMTYRFFAYQACEGAVMKVANLMMMVRLDS